MRPVEISGCWEFRDGSVGMCAGALNCKGQQQKIERTSSLKRRLHKGPAEEEWTVDIEE